MIKDFRSTIFARLWDLLTKVKSKVIQVTVETQTKQHVPIFRTQSKTIQNIFLTLKKNFLAVKFQEVFQVLQQIPTFCVKVARYCVKSLSQFSSKLCPKYLEFLTVLLSPSGLVGRGRRTPCSLGIRVFQQQCLKYRISENSISRSCICWPSNT